MKSYLGIDYGSKDIGLALGDSDMRLAVPIASVKNDNEVVENIKNLCKTHSINSIVVGMPRSFDNTHTNESMEAATHFAEKLRGIDSVTIKFESELFTSKIANTLHSTGSKDDIHSKSAMLLLQTFIDRTYGNS